VPPELRAALDSLGVDVHGDKLVVPLRRESTLSEMNEVIEELIGVARISQIILWDGAQLEEEDEDGYSYGHGREDPKGADGTNDLSPDGSRGGQRSLYEQGLRASANLELKLHDDTVVPVLAGTVWGWGGLHGAARGEGDFEYDVRGDDEHYREEQEEQEEQQEVVREENAQLEAKERTRAVEKRTRQRLQEHAGGGRVELLTLTLGEKASPKRVRMHTGLDGDEDRSGKIRRTTVKGEGERKGKGKGKGKQERGKNQGGGPRAMTMSVTALLPQSVWSSISNDPSNRLRYSDMYFDHPQQNEQTAAAAAQGSGSSGSGGSGGQPSGGESVNSISRPRHLFTLPSDVLLKLLSGWVGGAGLALLKRTCKLFAFPQRSLDGSSLTEQAGYRGLALLRPARAESLSIYLTVSVLRLGK
jgi:hypothetical protein